MPKKSLLILLRHTPYGNSLARAGHDVALAAAAFEQPVSLLFMDDGVWQLVPEQDPAAIGAKNIAKALDSLPLYGIESIHAEAESLSSRGLAANDIRSGVRLLNSGDAAGFIDSFDQVLSF